MNSELLVILLKSTSNDEQRIVTLRHIINTVPKMQWRQICDVLKCFEETESKKLAHDVMAEVFKMIVPTMHDDNKLCSIFVDIIGDVLSYNYIMKKIGIAYEIIKKYFPSRENPNTITCVTVQDGVLTHITGKQYNDDNTGDEILEVVYEIYLEDGLHIVTKYYVNDEFKKSTEKKIYSTKNLLTH